MKPPATVIAEALVDVMHIQMLNLLRERDILWDELEKHDIDPVRVLTRARVISSREED